MNAITLQTRWVEETDRIAKLQIGTERAKVMKTEVGIIGAGPAGLLLARMLQLNGIETIILERSSRDHVLGRIRAGILEPGTVATLTDCGVSERLNRENIPHEFMTLRWEGRRHDVPLVGDDGRRLTTYGQNRVVEDLVVQRERDGLPLLFEADIENLSNIEAEPKVSFRYDGRQEVLTCKFVAGCDGFWGISRKYIPDADAKSFLKEFPFGWLGILADAEMVEESRGFAHHADGLAVSSARGPHTTRLYLQKPWDFDLNSISDEQIWDELERRLDDGSGLKINRGPILDRGFARLRGFVCEAMQYGNLAIAGDAAHIVPPSGAKGLNLAVGDVRILSEAITRLTKNADRSLLARYSEIALRRIWPTVHWSCLMTEALHLFPDQTSFDTKRQFETLRSWCETEAGRVFFREAMLGLPFEV